ncbi:MAG: dephospho-CoA kinase [Cyanobacterium sp. T60_A2020_053]|nr:dephospho-CoA kinase [Cyanobacterium sp. T60_A2020_053]
MKKFNDSIVIGITGGIATGKTTVTHYLAEKYQFPVIDADILAREAVAINTPIYDLIMMRYGDQISFDNGHLNRQKLGEIIFNNQQEKIWLESLIHPFVYKKITEKISSLPSSIIILSVPLLFEANMADLTSVIWVVYCDLSQQLIRLQTRNNLDRRGALMRINSQMSLSEKVKKGDFILNNNGNKEQLYRQIDQEISTII